MDVLMNDHIVPGFDEDTCDSLTIALEKVEEGDSFVALRLSGQIDTYSSHYFQRSVKRVIDAGYRNIIFLLAEVDYISSMGVGAFVQLQRAVKEKQGDIALVDVHPKIREIFKLMCMEKFFSCTDDVDQALVALTTNGRPAAFPRAVTCPICAMKLRASSSGRFRCPKCRTILFVHESGNVFLG